MDTACESRFSDIRRLLRRVDRLPSPTPPLTRRGRSLQMARSLRAVSCDDFVLVASAASLRRGESFGQDSSAQQMPCKLDSRCRGGAVWRCACEEDRSATLHTQLAAADRSACGTLVIPGLPASPGCPAACLPAPPAPPETRRGSAGAPRMDGRAAVTRGGTVGQAHSTRRGGPHERLSTAGMTI